MLRRAVVLMGIVALILGTYLVGTLLGGRARSVLAPTSQSGVATQRPGTTPGLPFGDAPGTDGTAPAREQVEVTMSSVDVPGCFDADQTFNAVVRSRWRDLQSENVLTFVWTPAEGTDGAIQVRVFGQTLEPVLGQGDAMPDVTLSLPLGATSLDVKLTTFIFDSWDESGAACFVWRQPPGTPRRFDFDPTGQGQA